ncbi:MAG: nitric-oxide reductase large subunit [Armatimonadetes bacterium]|nr:nitric-oxide reductase large subunit [Armatimonadota bacterium]
MSIRQVANKQSAVADSGKVWKHGLLLALLLGFSGLLLGGVAVYRNAAPIPRQIVGPDGQVLATAADIQKGKETYQRLGLMDYGSVLGHGAYLGQDFTAESLHLTVGAMRDYHAQQRYGRPYAALSTDEQASIAAQVKREIRTNRYDPQSGTLTLTAAQVASLRAVEQHYRALFDRGFPERALPAGMLAADSPEAGQIAQFFAWTSWLSAVQRPGQNHSFTNNWPYDEDAGNTATFGALIWSAASVALLLVFLGLILFVHHRYRLAMQQAYRDGDFPRIEPGKLPLTPSQRATAKYFAVVVALFLAQSLLGGLMAHYYVNGSTFYGIDLSRILPFHIARTWHLQLAVFWIATAWLGLGIFVAPIVSGREPKRQKLLVNVLFGALVLVVVGSLAGEWLGATGRLGNLWFLLGHQGWEYLELGRIWQVLLAAGLGIWLFIVYRALRGALKAESDRGGLTHLLLYSAISIPFFYGFAFLVNPSTHLTMSDYWRWWVIHLWVEGMFEVFAVVVIGFLMVNMGLVTRRSAVRALYFQLLILLASGVIGTGHHYYWIGAPEMWIALGAVFSALEVIPLSLLAMEAYDQYKVVQAGGVDFGYKVTFWFLLATAFWNLFGAGVLGFFINLPFVSYFQHGSFLTAAHGHGALMGVYGMLAIALMTFALRNTVRENAWNERLLKVAFWGLNLGLMGMIWTTLVPVGWLQLLASYEQGFWHARSFEFYQTPLVQTLLWVRILPDSVFIAFGCVPLLIAVVRAWLNQREATVGEEAFPPIRNLEEVSMEWIEPVREPAAAGD